MKASWKGALSVRGKGEKRRTRFKESLNLLWNAWTLTFREKWLSTPILSEIRASNDKKNIVKVLSKQEWSIFSTPTHLNGNWHQRVAQIQTLIARRCNKRFNKKMHSTFKGKISLTFLRAIGYHTEPTGERRTSFDCERTFAMRRS